MNLISLFSYLFFSLWAFQIETISEFQQNPPHQFFCMWNNFPKQTTKNQFMESSPCPTIGTAQKRNLHIFGPKTHGCKEGGPPCLNGSLRKNKHGRLIIPPNKNCLVVEPPHPSEKYAQVKLEIWVPQFSGGTFQKMFELPPVISSFTFLGAIVTHLKLPIP